MLTSRGLAPLLIVVLMVSGSSVVGAERRWHEIVEPVAGPPRVIGSYAAGCLQGAKALPSEGRGFRAMRLDRGRSFGHPILIDYISQLGRRLAKEKLGPLNLGDLGHARGGPSLTGHISHQTGLDVDIWLWMPEDTTPIPVVKRANISAPSMLTEDRRDLNPAYWSDRQMRLLKVAANFTVVQRIFVTALIKRALCTRYTGEPWLRKIRPWWGHHRHFHVRLHCPAGQPGCVKQAPPPPGPGCDASLAWWLTDEARNPPKSKPKEIVLPPACQVVLER